MTSLAVETDQDRTEMENARLKAQHQTDDRALQDIQTQLTQAEAVLARIDVLLCGAKPSKVLTEDLLLVERFSPRPGDVIVLNTTEACKTRVVKLARELEAILPHGCITIIVTPEVTLEQMDESLMRAAGWQRVPTST